jgi:hypothetical protein
MDDVIDAPVASAPMSSEPAEPLSNGWTPAPALSTNTAVT